MLKFEFHAYKGDADGMLSDRAEVTIESLRNEASARSKAGRLAKSCNGPVDLARCGLSAWNKRYITTANPSDYHATGYRFERLT